MAGYADDWSMSNNAVAAYERGLRPRSKWNKRDILDALPADKRAALHLDNYPFAFLREHFLSWEEWHHTSKQYNCTDFYLPRIPEWVETTEDVDTLYQKWTQRQEKDADKKTTAPVKARVTYTHWVDKAHLQDDYRVRDHCRTLGTHAERSAQKDQRKILPRGPHLHARTVWNREHLPRHRTRHEALTQHTRTHAAPDGNHTPPGPKHIRTHTASNIYTCRHGCSYRDTL